MVGDAALMVVLSPLTMIGPLVLSRTPDEWPYLLWGLAYTLPLLWRSTRPDWCAAGVVGAHVIQLIVDHGFNGANLVVPVVMYSVAVWSSRRRAALWLCVGLAGALAAAVDFGGGPRAPGVPPVSATVAWIEAGVTAALCGAVVVASWLLGMLARQRREAALILAERADALERERAQSVQLAASEERARIAREMHDLVAHSLSVIVVQVDGASYLIDSGEGDRDSGLRTARSALGTIGESARSALQETRRLVGLLRSEEDTPDLAPQACLADLPELIAPLRRAGLPVTLTERGDPARTALEASAELAAYRIVQESLTNVLKHAGPARVEVDLEHRPETLAIRVTDDGRGAAAPDDGLGHGLVGMQERATAHGGTLAAGPRAGGGFEVAAVLPRSREAS